MTELIEQRSPALVERPAFSLTSGPLLTVYGVIAFVVALGLSYPSTLAGKTFTLLGLTMAGALVGAWHGRKLSRGMFWGAVIAGFVGMLAIGFLAPRMSLPVLVAAMLAWGWLEGLMLGPVLSMYVEALGAETVSGAFAITACVMGGCAVTASYSQINTAKLGPYLFFGLLALIVVGLVNLFRSFSAQVSKAYALLGMALFTGFFLFDFARLKQSPQNTWSAAANMAIAIYLDFINFFLYLLRFLAARRHH